jgi:hypothetical protein
MEPFKYINKERSDRRLKYQQRQTWGLPEPTHIISLGIKGDVSHKVTKCIAFSMKEAHRMHSKKVSWSIILYYWQLNHLNPKPSWFSLGILYGNTYIFIFLQKSQYLWRYIIISLSILLFSGTWADSITWLLQTVLE